MDDTVWAEEIEALRLELPLVELWDRIRRTGDGWGALTHFDFGEILLGRPGPWILGEAALEMCVPNEAVDSLSAAEFGERIGRWQAAGYKLEQVEVRQARFTPGPVRRSEFEFVGHVERLEGRERLVVRGRLGVRWGEGREGDDPLQPAQIEVTQWEMIRRRGDPAFALGLSVEIYPVGDSPFVDPLIVRDLNGDGRSEILLPCGGVVFRNRGGGQFVREALGLRQRLNTAVVEDFDGDGMDDLLGADHGGLWLFRGMEGGAFEPEGRRVWETPEPLPNPYVMAVGDIDGDGDLDLWLAQYKLPYVVGQMPHPYYDANDGFPGFLLVNSGKATFRDATEAAGLAAKRYRRVYACSFVDLDGDGDSDLLVTSDFAGVDLYRNDGRGWFEDVTASTFDDPRVFGMAHALADYDQDGVLDILAIGMNLYSAERLDHLGLGPPETPEVRAMRARMAYGNRLYFGQGTAYAQRPMSRDIARSGWSWGVTSLDFDLDGDLDVYITNGHKSRETARDYESQFWRHDIYVATSEPDPVRDYFFQSVARRLYGAGYSYGGYEKNRFYLNRSGKRFLEVGYLMGVSLERDCRNVVSEDLDGDGAPDLLVMTYEEWPRKRQTLNLFRNVWQERGNWIGVRLRGSPRNPVTRSQVRLLYAGESPTRHFITGDSHRSQHSTTALFGLGERKNVDAIEVRWADGKRQVIDRPEVGRYYHLERLSRP